MITSARDEKTQKILAISICGLISYFPILNFINLIFNQVFKVNTIYDTLIFYLIFFTIIIFAVFSTFKTIKKDILLVVLGMLIIFIFTYLVYPENRYFMFTNTNSFIDNPIFIFIIFNISAYILTRNLKNYKILYEIMKKFSIVVILVSFIIFLFDLSLGTTVQYMVFSYNMLPHSLFLLFVLFEEKKIIFGCIGVLGSILIFIGGARGPALITLVSLFIFLTFKNENFIGKIKKLTIGIVILIVVIIYFENILNILYDFLLDIGYNSRTLLKLLENSFLDSSGRNIIYRNLIKSFNIAGYGIYGDRALIGTYAHNIFIEIIIDYGVIIGIPLILILFRYLYLAITVKDKILLMLTISFFASGVLKLLITGSYLNQEPSLYIIIALGVNISLRRMNNESFMVV